MRKPAWQAPIPLKIGTEPGLYKVLNISFFRFAHSTFDYFMLQICVPKLIKNLEIREKEVSRFQEAAIRTESPAVVLLVACGSFGSDMITINLDNISFFEE